MIKYIPFSRIKCVVMSHIAHTINAAKHLFYPSLLSVLFKYLWIFRQAHTQRNRHLYTHTHSFVHTTLILSVLYSLLLSVSLSPLTVSSSSPPHFLTIHMYLWLTFFSVLCMHLWIRSQCIGQQKHAARKQLHTHVHARASNRLKYIVDYGKFAFGDENTESEGMKFSLNCSRHNVSWMVWNSMQYVIITTVTTSRQQ